MRYYALYVYTFLYFNTFGLAMFISKYYGEIGLAESQIGILTSLPTVAALLLMPAMGTLADRVPKKRYLLTAWVAFAAAACFLVIRCEGLIALLFAVTGYTIFSTAAQPLGTTIALEHCESVGRPYGPVRLIGTIGYQSGALLVSVLLSHSLKNLYPLIGALLLLSGLSTFALPNVVGHQHSRTKIPFRRLFADRHVRMLYLLILYATCTSQFFAAFFTKHLGDLGLSNTAVSWITLLAVAPELPFLYFGDRIARKTSVWNWLLIGMAVNGVRWLGLAVSKTVPAIMAFQILSVAVLSCFEFIPALYLSRRVPPEMSGSAQTILTLTTFGAGKIIGGLLGGYICERTGIPAVFAFNGAMLLVGCAAFWKPTRRLIREEA